MKPTLGVPLEFIPQILFDQGDIDELLKLQLDELWTTGFSNAVIEQVESLGFILENKTNGPLSQFDYFNVYTNTNTIPRSKCKSIW